MNELTNIKQVPNVDMHYTVLDTIKTTGFYAFWDYGVDMQLIKRDEDIELYLHAESLSELIDGLKRTDNKLESIKNLINSLEELDFEIDESYYYVDDNNNKYIRLPSDKLYVEKYKSVSTGEKFEYKYDFNQEEDLNNTDEIDNEIEL